MPGRASASAIDLTAEVADGRAQAIAPGRSVTVLDARPPVPWSESDEDASLSALRDKAGPEAFGIERRVQAAASRLRAELNEAAGGQASDHVMTLAHNASVAQLAVELQKHVSLQAFGRCVRMDGDKGQTEKGLHRLVGICAFATDLQQKAREAAIGEGKASKGSIVDGLRGLVGQSRPGVEVGEGQPRSPFSPPGGSSLGPSQGSTTVSPKPESE